MSVAFYVRVSSYTQTQAQTIEQQLAKLRDYCLSQGWEWTSEHIFRDDGYSGASLTRPGLDQLRDRIKAGQFERLILTAPDRLARKYLHQMLLLEEFEKNGCQVEFLEHPMSSDPNDQLLLQIRGAVAEYERTLIADRLRRGRQYKYKAGTLLPWTKPPFGYRSQPDQPRNPSGVYVEPEEAAIVREIFAFYLDEGASIAGVAKRLTKLGWLTPTGKNRWTLGSVRKILTNPVYTGLVYAGKGHNRPINKRGSALKAVGTRPMRNAPTPSEEWILVGQVEALVSTEQFEQVQAKLKLNKQRARRNNKAQTYLLRCLVSCGRCKLACSGQTRRGYSYYACHGRGSEAISCQEQRCRSRLIPMKKLDEAIWQDVCEVIREPELIKQAMERMQQGKWLPQELQARRENLKKVVRTLTNQIERLTQAYLEKIIELEEYGRRRAELESKEQAMQTQIQELERNAAQQLELSGYQIHLSEFCERVGKNLETATFEQKRQILELLIDRIVVNNEEVEIRYVIPVSASGERTKFYQLRTLYCITQSGYKELEKYLSRFIFQKVS